MSSCYPYSSQSLATAQEAIGPVWHGYRIARAASNCARPVTLGVIPHYGTAMANIGSLLKTEIIRLARKEARAHVEPLRKSNASLRRDVAALKRQVIDQQRQFVKTGRASTKQSVPTNESPNVRFNAKGLRSHRARLGLSAADYGQLAAVSAQSIYNWESGKAVPRRTQVSALAGLRSLGKREAIARLEAMQSPAKKRG